MEAIGGTSTHKGRGGEMKKNYTEKGTLRELYTKR